MKKTLITSLFVLAAYAIASAQTQKPDTVVVELAKSSRVLLIVKDKSDLATLKAYNYQALFNDILAKIDAKDTTLVVHIEPQEQTSKNENWSSYNFDRDDTTSRQGYYKGKRYRNRKSFGSINFDLGMNNFLSDGNFPDEDNAPYAVRPWGSWYFAINSTQKIRIAGKFFTELGLGVSWYNFKFQNDGITLQKGPTGVEFLPSPADVDPRKSKLTVCYINASLIPMLDFGKHPHRSRFWGSQDGFRIGAGPYVGYRIDSYTKQVYELNGDKERDRSRSNLYLNNLRYGARLQVGYKGTDLFMNYDMNELFAENRGPKLNAFSFGVIF